MIDLTRLEVLELIQLVNSELDKLKNRQLVNTLEGHEFVRKERLHSIDAKLDSEYTLQNFKDRKLRDL